MALNSSDFEPVPEPGSSLPSGVFADRVSFQLDGAWRTDLHVESYTCDEAISKLYRLEVELRCDLSASYRPDAFLGKRVAIKHARVERERCFTGIVTQVAAEAPFDVAGNGLYFFYRLTIMPRMWLLTQNVNCRVFPEYTDTAELLNRVLRDDVYLQFELRFSSDVRRFRAQYNESDFNFLSRTMEEEGIFYFFDQSNPEHGELVIFGDNIGDYRTNDFREARAELSQMPWEDRLELSPERLGVRGYDFVVKEPDEASVSNRTHPPSWTSQRFYESVPEGVSANYICNWQSRLRMEGLEWGAHVCSGEGHSFDLMPGYFLMRPAAAENAVILSVRHEYSQQYGYRNSFVCMPRDTVFRPPRTTPRPSIGGTQTALVVQPASQDPNAMGRVAIRFHWQGETDHWCWTRVSQPWAGKNYGAYFPPLAGDEVVVSFQEGDPAQPIVVGRVHHGMCEDMHSEEYLTGWTTASQSKIVVSDKPNAETITIEQECGNKIELKRADESIVISNASGALIRIDRLGVITISAPASLHVVAPVINLEAPMVRCLGVVKCQSLITDLVISHSYTPGAGNIW